MDIMKNLCKPENEAEAIALQGILADHGITAMIRSFHDTAYDGIFQSQYGWGMIMVDEADFAEAERIISDWQKAIPGNLDWEENSD